jgi:HD superfamily phosphodiesterase
MSNHLKSEKPTPLKTEKSSEIEERLQAPQMVAAAADLTRYILEAAPDRLSHSQGVARRARFLTLTVEPPCAPLLVAAAWLHDIGYAPGLRDTGFHPVDGARHLRAVGWPPAICNLSPTTPERVSSPEFSGSTGNWTRTSSPRTQSPTP